MERTLRSTRAFDGRLIGVRVDEVERPDGRHATREIVEHPGAVAILAWDGARLAMVRQWRHAVGDVLLEIPAGTMEESEEPLATARRELAEEMGIAAASWTRGPSFYTAPGFCTERLTLFLATELHEVETRAPDDEQIEREWLSLAQALDGVDDGRVADAKSIVGILWLAARLPDVS
ncbi:MAG: NUDIX domain-containing protein [Candidatus Limnocylindria bacterium]